MSQPNGSDRLNRIEAALELFIADHEQFRDEHKVLLTAQVLLTGQVQKIGEQVERTSQQIQALTLRMDDLTKKLDVLTVRVYNLTGLLEAHVKEPGAHEGKL